MVRLNVWLLGKLRLQVWDGPLLTLNAQRAQELLCYLLLHRNRAFARETLAEQLWGNCDASSNAGKILRQAIWHLQTDLAELEAQLHVPLIHVESSWIQFNSAIEIWSDVDTLRQAFTYCQGIAGSKLCEPAIPCIREAVGLYQGDLLEGCYENWCLFERERLQHLYLAMLDKLMDYYESRQDYDTSITYGAWILRHDRARECTHYRLMRLFFHSGDRTSALRQYQRCVAVLDEELGVGPAESTAALYKEIISGPYTEPRLSGKTAGVGPQPPLHEVIQRLEHYQSVLSYMQSRVEQEISMARQALSH